MTRSGFRELAYFVMLIRIFIFLIFFFSTFFIYFWEIEMEHEQGRGRERETQNLKQAPSSKRQHRALHGARTRDPEDHDRRRSQMLNQLSHPGTLL